MLAVAVNSIYASMAMALTPPSLVGLDSAADAGLVEGLAALESYKKKDSVKGQRPLNSPTGLAKLRGKSLVVVRFKAVGNAPIMKQNFFRVTVSNRFQAVIQFLRKELGWKAGEPLVSTFLLAYALSVRRGCLSSSRISIWPFPPHPTIRSRIYIA
jgi:hypothetical protein